MKFTIEQARKFSGKTQSEIAKSLGICRDTYRKIEKHPEEATIKQGKEFSKIVSIPFDDISFGP